MQGSVLATVLELLEECHSKQLGNAVSLPTQVACNLGEQVGRYCPGTT